MSGTTLLLPSQTDPQAAAVSCLLLSVSRPAYPALGLPNLQHYEMALPDAFVPSPAGMRRAFNGLFDNPMVITFADPEGGCMWLMREGIDAMSLRLVTKVVALTPPASETEVPPSPQPGSPGPAGATAAGEAPLPAADSIAPAEPTLALPALAAAAAGDPEPIPAAPATVESAP